MKTSISVLLDKVLEKTEKDGLIEKYAQEHADSFKDFTDIEGLIIRGHILIEKSLINSITNVAYKKEEFKADKFTFAQKAIIARMYGISGLFDNEINALNKLRNQIAHSLNFEEKYIDVIINGVASKDKKNEYPKEDKLNNLKRAISFICGVIMIDGYYAQVGQTMKGIKFLKSLE